MRTTRLASIAGCAALAALLAACSSSRAPVASTGPAPAANVNIPAALEYGRVTNIQPIGGTAARGAPSAPGAPGVMVGAVAGGVPGGQAGAGRTATTALGAPGGAAVGQVGRTSGAPQLMYRVTVQTEGGALRYYDVPATNDLRVGDRVHVEHGVAYLP
jgi:hypothetical protein